MARSPERDAFHRRMAAKESRRRARFRRLGESRYTSRLLNWTLAFLALLVVRSIVVTHVSDPPDVQLDEAWSLLVSLQLDDYVNVLYGLVATNAAQVSLAIIIVAWLIWRLESPSINLDEEWNPRGPTLLLILIAGLPVAYLIYLADWWWKVALAATVTTIFVASNTTTGLPAHVRRRKRRAIRRKIKDNHNGLPDDITNHSRNAVLCWSKLSLYMSQRATDVPANAPSDPISEEVSQGVVDYYRAADEEDINRKLAMLKMRNLERRGTPARLDRRRRWYLRWVRLRNRAFPRLAEPLGLVAFVLVTTAVLNPQPWVPLECFSIAGRPNIQGYRMSDTGSILTILIDDTRTVLAEPTGQVASIETGPC